MRPVTSLTVAISVVISAFLRLSVNASPAVAALPVDCAIAAGPAARASSANRQNRRNSMAVI